MKRFVIISKKTKRFIATNGEHVHNINQARIFSRKSSATQALNRRKNYGKLKVAEVTLAVYNIK